MSIRNVRKAVMLQRINTVDESSFIDTPKVEVVDTVGTVDSFTAAFPKHFDEYLEMSVVFVLNLYRLASVVGWQP